MLARYERLKKCKIDATDGEIGHVSDVYFDDHTWRVRYLVVDTGGWLSGRSVLLAPHVFQPADLDAKLLPTHLTREQIQHSPDIDMDKPVSRQHEELLHHYYGWPYYGAGGSLVSTRNVGAHPEALAGHTGILDPAQGAPGPTGADPGGLEVKGDPHLRSAGEVIGYAISAVDGEIGKVDDLVLEEDDWVVRYLVVNTGSWLSEREVLLACSWVHAVSWSDSAVRVDLDRETLRSSPELDSSRLTRTDEKNLFRHYGKTGYW